MKFFKSIISEKDGKGSAKRIAGLIATILFIQIIQVVIWHSVSVGKDIANQAIILKALEYSFIIISVALVGIAAPTIAGIIKGNLPNFTTNQGEDEKVG